MSGTHAPARLVLAGLCAVTLVACGGSSDSSSSSGASSSSSATSESGSTASTITIKSFAFTTPDSVSPGASITVNNEDSVPHTVTADNGKAFDDAASPGTSTFSAPMNAGSYPFHCNIHPEMHGTLVVK